MFQGDLPNLLRVKPATFSNICVELDFVDYLVFVTYALEVLDDLWAWRVKGCPFFVWREGKRVENRRSVSLWLVGRSLKAEDQTYTSQATPGSKMKRISIFDILRGTPIHGGLP